MGINNIDALKGEPTATTSIGECEDGSIYEPQHTHIYALGHSGNTSLEPGKVRYHMHYIKLGTNITHFTQDHFHKLGAE